MTHFSHPPLQVYRRCRLKKKKSLQIILFLACLQEMNVLWTEAARLCAAGDAAETQGLCFPHAPERAGHQKKLHFPVLRSSGRCQMDVELHLHKQTGSLIRKAL